MGGPTLLADTWPGALGWSFPLPRPHCGVPLGNGRLGLLVWGEGRHLRLTVALAGFWDHRGGTPFAAVGTFADVRRWLEADDQAAIDRAFGGAAPPPPPGRDRLRPRQWGLGRVEVVLPEGAELGTARWELAGGLLSVGLADGTALTVHPSFAADLFEVAGLPEGARLRIVPTGAHRPDASAANGLPPPEIFAGPGEGLGWRQELPEDAAGWVRADRRGRVLRVAAGRGAYPAAPVPWPADEAPFWPAFWAAVPQVETPEPALNAHYRLSLAKLARMTHPAAPAATLQGPWMEEYQPPPWSNDYHFNVNVQMIYTPLLAAGLRSHFQPLWDLLDGWRGALEANGRSFFGAPDALLLPHATDDRMQVVGPFWTGTIDHACTAWMALLAWDFHRWFPDAAFLRRTVWPLLRGAFAGYWAMAEETTGPDGATRLSLPVGVSPEYSGASLRAWGRDPSWQLAAAHATARALQAAAAELGEEADPRWARLRAALPPYTTVPQVDGFDHPEVAAAGGYRPRPGRGAEARPGPRIGLWAGKDLDTSHRHHSHLGALYPFRTVDPADPAHAPVVAASLNHWTRTGPGAWSGWCVPWAAILHLRGGQPDAALARLRLLLELYTNEGGATLHDGAFPGLTTLANPHTRPGQTRRVTAYGEDGAPAVEELPAWQEVMQCDAAMGLLDALHHFCAHELPDGALVHPAPPRAWPWLRFRRLRVPGGRSLDGDFAAGRWDVRPTPSAA